jgi:hypothetical protein
MPASDLTPSKCHLSRKFKSMIHLFSIYFLHLCLAVYFKIFWIRGKIVRLQVKNRQKSNSDKNLSDLEKAKDDFSV